MIISGSFMEEREQQYFVRDLYRAIDKYLVSNFEKPYTMNMNELLSTFLDYGITPDTGDEEEDEIEYEYNRNVISKIYKAIESDAINFILERCENHDISTPIHYSENKDELIKSIIEYTLKDVTMMSYDYDRITATGWNRDLMYKFVNQYDVITDCISVLDEILSPIKRNVDNTQSVLYSNDELVELYYQYD